MLPLIRFLAIADRYKEPLLYRSNVEAAKLEKRFSGVRLTSENPAAIFCNHSERPDCWRKETPWTHVTLLAITRCRSKSHLLCANRPSLQLRKLPPSYALLSKA